MTVAKVAAPNMPAPHDDPGELVEQEIEGQLVQRGLADLAVEGVGPRRQVGGPQPWGKSVVLVALTGGRKRTAAAPARPAAIPIWSSRWTSAP
jgi:hypothetical protein